MFFSKDRWNDAEEIQPYIKTSSALSFESCESSFADVEEKFLLPVFGRDIIDAMNDYYRSDERGDELKDALLRYLQNAEANLALADHFTEFQVRITDQGFQRQDTENFKMAYRGQEITLQRLMMNRGLNAIDAAILFLDASGGYFPAWAETDFCKYRKTLVVRSAKEVNEVHFVNNSSLIYMRMMPIIRRVTELKLPKVLGRELYQKMMEALDEGREFVAEGFDKMTAEELRKECSRYIVFLSLAELLKESGSITERGLYFHTEKATASEPTEAVPATRSQNNMAIASLLANAQSYKAALESTVELCFTDFFVGHESDIYKRDNRCKRSVWL